MADIQQLEDQIVSLSLLEASELVKKLEEPSRRFGSSSIRCGSARSRWPRGSRSRREDRVHRDPEGDRSEQDQHHQGRA